ncbi:hypothetical protein R3P38DRAFT_1459437 [Favolaschia claudopus]|uniref:XPG-I domain-containing protein n=1 Tax=Favolaschia claudopus TaxID=2862362 RepID=A0AAW0AKW2_9AGAR
MRAERVASAARISHLGRCRAQIREEGSGVSVVKDVEFRHTGTKQRTGKMEAVYQSLGNDSGKYHREQMRTSIRHIKLFGFHLRKAPGEAEAELAYLNRIGEIDAVLTDDGDAALFGATCILRNLDKNNKDNVTMYTSTALASHPDVHLTQGGIFLLAVLRGGDYDTTGLPNCGMSIAHGLAHCGFGDSLLAATQTISDTELQQFLVSWCAGVRTELETNASGHLKSKHKALAARLPDTFPNIKTLKLYAHSITSWSDGYIPPNPIHWRVRLPSLPGLALFVQKKFGWKPTDIVDKFKRLIFPAMCIRRLNLPIDLNLQLHRHVNLGRLDDEYPQLSSFLSIVARQEVVDLTLNDEEDADGINENGEDGRGLAMDIDIIDLT